MDQSLLELGCRSWRQKEGVEVYSYRMTVTGGERRMWEMTYYFPRRPEIAESVKH